MIFSRTVDPKTLKPARAIRATTATRIMYSTRLAPRESLESVRAPSIPLVDARTGPSRVPLDPRRFRGNFVIGWGSGRKTARSAAIHADEQPIQADLTWEVQE